MASGDTKTEALLNVLGNGGDATAYKGCCNTKTQQYILDAIDRVQGVEDEVEELKNNPDVVDIVDTYQDLQDYDTSTLTDKDIVRVLSDSTHSGNSTYYRWNASTNQFDFVGEIAGGGSVTPVQTTGTSTTDVMSQNAVTDSIYANNFQYKQVRIGATYNPGQYFGNTVQVGYGAKTQGIGSIALGCDAFADSSGGIAIGCGSTANGQGVMNIGTSNTYKSSQGYHQSNYRLLSGLYDPQSDHDAATKGYVDANAGGFTTLTTEDYNWNSSTGQTGTPNCVALWLLPSGIYEGPANSSIDVRATRTQDYSMGSGFPSYAIVKQYEGVNNRAIVTYFDGGSSSIIEYYSIDQDGLNYSTKRFPDVVQSTGTSTTNVMSQKAVTDALASAAIGTTESYTIATNSWSALSASSPYTYSATVTATYTIGNNTIAELINDNAVTFSNYGFAIGSISGQNVTIYSIGQPDASITLKVNYKG